MTIKKLHVGFDLDVELFARMLMNAGNMKIEVYGDAVNAPAKPARRVKGPKAPKLLAPPRKHSKPLRGAHKIILDHLFAHKDETFAPKDLVPLVTDAGYKPGTVHGSLHTLQEKKLLKYSNGRYQVAAKALTQQGGTTDGQG